MKKFFTLITLMTACIPAIHGMEANYLAGVKKKHSHLITLIKNADVEAFKRAFDEAKLPSSNSLRVNAAKMESIKAVAALEQAVLETKVAVVKELDVLGDNNKDWLKIIKGSLATFTGGIIGIAGIIDFTLHFKANRTKNDIAKITAACTFGFPAAYKSLTYGPKTFNVGWNYKQYLQDQLINLDAIAAHIAHGTAQAA